MDESRTMVEFVDWSRMDESRTMVEFVDDPRHVGKLVEQALVELRTRSLVELGTRSLVGLRPVVETKRRVE